MLPAQEILVNAVSIAFLCLEIWLLGERKLNALPGYLLFGLAVGASLTFVL
jgi:hypothetical protein